MSLQVNLIMVVFFWTLFLKNFRLSFSNIHNTGVEEDFSERKNVFNYMTYANGTLELRILSCPLYKYTSYKDVTILHFRVPSDTLKVIFKFSAYEDSKDMLQRRCIPQNISLHIKPRSYPVLDPENVYWPKNFLNQNQRLGSYTLHFVSDNTTQKIEVNSPLFGNWFAVAFISWSNLNSEKIEQQGIASSCETVLTADMFLERVIPIILTEGKEINGSIMLNYNGVRSDINQTQQISKNYELFKFFTPFNVDRITVNLSFNIVCDKCPHIVMLLKANSIPNAQFDEASTSDQKEINVIPTKQCFEFNVQSEYWYYLKVQQAFFSANNHNKNINIAKKKHNSNINYELGFKINIKYSKIGVEFEENVGEKTVFNRKQSKDFDTFVYQNVKFMKLLRKSYGEFFVFNYDLMPFGKGKTPGLVNLTADLTVGFMINIGDISDIGGTLTFSSSLVQSSKHSTYINEKTSHHTYEGIVSKKLVNDPTFLNERFKEIASSFSKNHIVIICIYFGRIGEPIYPDKCKYGHKIFPAAAILNDSSPNRMLEKIHIPYPESGRWFITLRLYCNELQKFTKVTLIEDTKNFIWNHSTLLRDMKPPCVCAQNALIYEKCSKNLTCLAALNENDTEKIKGCIIDPNCTGNSSENAKILRDLYAAAETMSGKTCNTSLLFTISSTPCILGGCGPYGKCYHYMSGGFVFSTCVCSRGYKGWDCSDDSNVPSKVALLIASSFLVLSNFFFIISIIAAIKRKCFTESLIFSFTMFFSIFYHACDSGDGVYSFCLFPINVLQFCDFYCGLLSIWVTLVAMAQLNQPTISILQMGGAILLAFGTQWNKQSLWNFLGPTVIGILIIIVSWVAHYKKTKKKKSVKKYMKVYFPMGLICVIIGLVCYAFLQTKKNYYIVHSIWHMLMALSILCLIPPGQSCRCKNHNFLSN